MQALKAPPTSLNKWIAAAVLADSCTLRVSHDYPTSDLIKRFQLARNLFIQSYGRVHN
jgi:hypothetical protein